jgi:MYXO-CTERM domain-containing protein
MIGLGGAPSLSMAQTEQTSQTAQNRSRGAEGGTGQRSSVFVNFAQEGSSLSASTDGGSKVPPWLWAVLIAGAAGLGIWVWKRRTA